ncbi:MAG: V-type ATP synthase subunit D [Gammaproteobacteria bacterium]|nr:V-type ATP synthase subunit D [Gammaproteobacteria bacterium]
MSARMKVPPTKSALLGLRRQLRFLQQGHSMLERKRELLNRLVRERLERYHELHSQARAVLAQAYRWLAVAQMRMGSQVIRQAALGTGPAVRVEIFPRSSVGIEYPAARAEEIALQPVGLMGTDASFDQARSGMARTAVLLVQLGEAETALWRLLTEQRRTQRRVNALRYNIIPRYRATIRFIDSMLEEDERTTLFQIKRLRQSGRGV